MIKRVIYGIFSNSLLKYVRWKRVMILLFLHTGIKIPLHIKIINNSIIIDRKCFTNEGFDNWQKLHIKIINNYNWQKVFYKWNIR